MKKNLLVDRRPFANPDVAARKLIEIANDFEVVQEGRIYIEHVIVRLGADAGYADHGAITF